MNNYVLLSIDDSIFSHDNNHNNSSSNNNKRSRDFDERPHCRGILHWDNFMRHSTATAAGHLERWSTACGEIPMLGTLGTVHGIERENADVILLKSATSSHGEEYPHLTHGLLGPPESTTQTASRLVQPFLQGSRSLQTDGPHYSVCSNRPHLASAAMWPNNNKRKIKTNVPSV